MKIICILLLFFTASLFHTGCVCTTHLKELTANKEEINAVKLDLQIKGKTIDGLLDRLSKKDQEIGMLIDKLHAAQLTIEELKSDIKSLREVDVQMEEKKKEVDNGIEETIPVATLDATQGTESVTADKQKTE